jgi:hypothetical protein
MKKTRRFTKLIMLITLMMIMMQCLPVITPAAGISIYNTAVVTPTTIRMSFIRSVKDPVRLAYAKSTSGVKEKVKMIFSGKFGYLTTSFNPPMNKRVYVTIAAYLQPNTSYVIWVCTEHGGTISSPMTFRTAKK